MKEKLQKLKQDKNLIREYSYTAKHFAKLYLNINVNVKNNGNYDERIYYTYNVIDLKAIINDKYIDAEKIVNRIQNDKDISKRQKSTIIEGINILKQSIENINKYM